MCILTYKYASRHSGVQFFDIKPSKSAPIMRGFVHFDLQNMLRATAACNFLTSNLRCFVHFDLQICFAPQPRAVFEHRNVQNGSDTVSFLAFSLANVLRATAACHFSPVCETATSAPAALASLLFEQQEPRIIEKKHSDSRRPSHFSRMYLFSGDSTRVLIFFLLT